MKIHIPTHLLILCSLLGCLSKSYAQKDTLHIYYQGLQTKVLDSNEVKITNWAKSLKAKHYDIEIYGYYDNSSFKDYITERVENVNTIVIRKARDLSTINFMGAVKGKKAKRLMVDIVYMPTGTVVEAAPRSAEKKEKPAAAEPARTEQKAQPTGDTKEDAKPVAAEKKEPKTKSVSAEKNDEYMIDSVYVNGVLKVTKKKIKKK